MDDFGDFGSIVIAAIAVIALAGLLPALFRDQLAKSRRKIAQRRSGALRAVKLEPDTGRHTDVGMKVGTMADTQMSRKRIEEVRALRKASIRRRRVVVAVLLVALVAVIVCSRVFRFSWLWALIPALLLVLVLGLGARAASVARKWEASVAQWYAREESLPIAQGTGREKGVTRPVVSRGADPSRPSSPSQEASGTSGDRFPQGAAAVRVESLPTHVIPLKDVRLVLRAQEEDKRKALEMRDRARRKREERKASEGRAGEGDNEAEETRESKVADADTHPARADGASTAKDAVVAQPRAAAQDGSAAQGEEADLISFSLGGSSPKKPESDKPEDPVERGPLDKKDSAPADPAEQEATYVTRPSEEERRRIFQDVTPSVTTLQEVPAPERTADSLGVDLDAVLARRANRR